MPFKILITDDIYTSGPELLRAQADVEVAVEHGLSAEELREHIVNYDAVITRSGTPLDAAFFESAAGHLKVAARAGIGLGNVDVSAATKAGVMVMNTPEVNAVAAAEMTLALILALCRNVLPSNAVLRQGQWERLNFMGTHLEGKTLGLVGLGRVGQEVAMRANAFQMRLLAFDPYVRDEVADKLNVELVEQLDDLLAEADIVSLHCQLTDETRAMIGAEQLARMKTGARLVNTAHGGLVDASALLDALKSGRLAGAALDVYETEPPSGASAALLQLPNVAATPHLGASTYEAQHDVSIRVVRQTLDALRGVGYHNVVNLPFADGDDYAKLAPFLMLAEKIGSLQMQLMDDKGAFMQGMRLRVCFRGDEIRDYPKPLAMALLKGLLTPLYGADVNYVNAPYLANERGLSTHQDALAGAEEFSNVIVCELAAGHEKRLIAGTLLTRSQPRIVRLDGIPMDVLPEGFMLVLKSHDMPGVIAQVASLLGDTNLNIGEYRLGRDRPGGTAFSFINLDSEAPESVLDHLRRLSPLIEVKQVCL